MSGFRDFRHKRQRPVAETVQQYYQPPGRRTVWLRRYGLIVAGVLAVGLAAAFLWWHANSTATTGADKKDQITETNPLANRNLYVDPNSNAATQARLWSNIDPANATLMYKLADQPSSHWFSNAVSYDEVHSYVQAANDVEQLPVTVAYFIPYRDCMQYSSGGAADQGAYYDYINTYASAIGHLNAVVILEPDALVHMHAQSHTGKTCLGDSERRMYTTLLNYAVDRFKSLPNTTVYIDAGNSGWSTDADTISALLRDVNVARADGFSLNVSNFRMTDETVQLGNRISDKLAGKHYVIDTSRNGLGPYDNRANPAYNWCNPPGRALGHYPTITTGVKNVDAYLYIKNIGESDGTDPDAAKCFGGPAAGTWWPEYAAGLVARWPQNLQFDGRSR